jgi:DNA-binding response OmpR family regulator
MSPTTNQPDVVALKGVPVHVVEDTWHVAKAMKSALEQLGMQVIGPTATCAEAKRLVAQRKPKVALVDINLKQEMAYSLIDELHAQSVQVIVVSGYAAPAVSKERIAAFLQKPFTESELITTVHAVVHLAR